MKNKTIFLDYASTTPVDRNVLKAMMPYFSEVFANPSSIHYEGQKAKIAIDEARRKIAELLNCEFEEVIFTSSATESNNLAIKGIAFWYLFKEKKIPHIITTKIEHKSVLEPIEDVKYLGGEISYLNVDKTGIIKLEELKKLIKENTVLVSCHYVNSEIGVIQPIKKISDILKKINKNRKIKIWLHTDAVQAVNYLEIDIKKLGVDLMTISSHKIYGPKGIALLYKSNSVKLFPLITGGGQENNIRSGTENVPGIIGFQKALEITQALKEKELKRIKSLRDYLIKKLTQKIKDFEINGSLSKRIPNNLNISIKGVLSDTLVMALDRKGISVSSGTACLAGSQEPSYVLMALGKSKAQALQSLRITLGRYTTKQDIEKFVDSLQKVLVNLKNI